MNNELKHHGIKGMKWGVRKYQNMDGTYTRAGIDRYGYRNARVSGRMPNANYSNEQRLRDRNVYGRGGVRRINKSMNSGMNISAARSKEANRIYKHRRIGVTAGQVGSVAGGVAGAVAGYALSNKALQKYGTGDPMTDMMIKSVVASGTFQVGKMLGRYGGQSIGMLSGGYSPKKFRYG